MRRSTAIASAFVLIGAAIVAAWLAFSSSQRRPADDSRESATGEAAGPALVGAGSLAAKPAADGKADDAPRPPAPIDPATSIAGRVVGPDGKPIANATVHGLASDPRGSPIPPTRWSSARTEDDGSFRLLRLRAKTPYWLEVDRRPGLRSPVVETTAGATDAVVAMLPTMSARVSVVDEDGAPVAQATVRVFGSTRRGARLWQHQVEAFAGGDGVAVVEGLEEFDRTVRISLGASPPDRRRRALRSNTLDAWAMDDTTLRLPKWLMVSGVVRDLEGKPLAGATVKAKSTGPDGSTNQDVTDARGRFRLTEVPRDTEYRIWATPHDAPEIDEPAGAQTARAGDADVVLRVDPGSALTITIDGWPEVSFVRARLLREKDGDQHRTWEAEVTDGGKVEFRALDSGTYTLWIPQPGFDAICVLETGLRPGAPVRVRVRKTRDIRVREDAPEPYRLHGVSARVGEIDVAETRWQGDDKDLRTIRDVPDDLPVHVSLHGHFTERADPMTSFALGEADVPPGTTEMTVPIVEKGRR